MGRGKLPPSPIDVRDALLTIPPGKVNWRTLAKAVCGNQLAPRVVVVGRLVDLMEELSRLQVEVGRLRALADIVEMRLGEERGDGDGRA